MLNTDMHAQVKREQYRDMIVDAAQRQTAVGIPHMSLTRHIARPLGRVLLRVGNALLGYGQVKRSEPLDYLPAVAVRLN